MLSEFHRLQTGEYVKVGYSNFEHNQQFRQNDDDLETDGRPGGDHREVNG